MNEALLLATLAWYASTAPSAVEPARVPLPPWNVKIGVSCVATSGNTQTSTAGLSTQFARDGERWALDGAAASLRSAQKGQLKAERHQANVRARRKLKAKRLRWTVGLASERNRFTGIDLRTVADTSLAWTIREGPDRRLQALAGLTWSHEDRLRGRGQRTVGGLLQASGGMKLSPTTDLAAELSCFPDLEDLADNRFAAKLTLGTALTRHVGLELGYDWRYDNRPVPGFGKMDATATTSVVVRLGTTP